MPRGLLNTRPWPSVSLLHIASLPARRSSPSSTVMERPVNGPLRSWKVDWRYKRSRLGSADSGHSRDDDQLAQIDGNTGC